MKKFLVCALLLLIATIASEGGSLNTANIDSSAKWFVHLDMELLRTSELGKFLLEEIEKPEAKAKLDAFKAILAFDPIRDVNSFTLSGNASSPENGVAIITGNFDPERILVLLRANDSYEKAGYENLLLHKWVDDNSGAADKTHWICFYKNNIAIMGNKKEKLIETIDLLVGKKNSISSQNSLMQMIPSTGKTIVSIAVGNMNEMENIPAQANLLKTAEGGGLAMWEENGNTVMEISVKTKTEELALSIHQIVQGWLALASLNQQQDPQITAIAQAAKVTVNGCNVTLNFRYPTASLIETIKKNMAEKKQQPTGEPDNPNQ